MEKLKKYYRSLKKWKQLTDSVTYFLAKDMLPLYSVEKEGFQRLVKTFDSQYQLPIESILLILPYQLCMLQLEKRYLIVYQLLNILLQPWDVVQCNICPLHVLHSALYRPTMESSELVPVTLLYHKITTLTILPMS